MIAADIVAAAQPVAGVSSEATVMVTQAALKAAAMEAAIHDLQRHVDTAIPPMLRSGLMEHTSELLDLARETKRSAFLVTDALRRIESDVGLANGRLGNLGDILQEFVAASEAEREADAARHDEIMLAVRSVADDARQAATQASRIVGDMAEIRHVTDGAAALLRAEIQPGIASLQADLERIHGTVEVVEAAAPVSAIAEAARDGAREGAREGLAAASRSPSRHASVEPPVSPAPTAAPSPPSTTTSQFQSVPERAEKMQAACCQATATGLSATARLWAPS